MNPPIPQADMILTLSYPGSGDHVWAAFIQVGRQGPSCFWEAPKGQILSTQAAGLCRLYPPSFLLQTFPELPTVPRPLPFLG